MKELETIAEKLGVAIAYTDKLPHDLDGAYLHHRKLILIRADLDYWSKRCALAHELGHAVYGDERCELPGQEPRLEKRADQWAAQFLITPEEYQGAEKLHGGHTGAIAYELGVTPHLINIWKNLYERNRSNAFRSRQNRIAACRDVDIYSGVVRKSTGREH